MDIPEITISLKCLFCGSDLEGPEDEEYNSGDLIKCIKCGKENDYDSVLEIAKDEGLEAVKAQLQNKLKNMFK
ncbi:hypothetical protein [Methylobacter sp.]|uniref:hypothetical protein n=1 Tax=Methylobacter sp. TaxID=2051955 RepID=UPI00248809A7|nr:hypothetical protein [Methylobacter sp.]MDI1276474.1 hypothetical protein [Methylobacter sp.]MDI1358471.1 hypothetical protein [Methylobacter sp.]